MSDLQAWDEIAATYAKCVGGEDDPIYGRFASFLWRNLGDDLAERSVLDLGCGHGWFAGKMAAKGARVVGVDGSGALLDIARAQNPHVRFEQADLTCGLPEELEEMQFDRVVSQMVVMDLPHLGRLGESLRACVGPGGRLVLTMLHPSFFLQSPYENVETGERYRKVTGYLQHEEWWITSFGGHRHYHRPLSFYVAWLADAGFAITEMFEPPVPSPKSESDQTDYERWFTSIPTMLGLVAVPLQQYRSGRRTDQTVVSSLQPRHT